MSKLEVYMVVFISVENLKKENKDLFLSPTNVHVICTGMIITACYHSEAKDQGPFLGDP